MNRRAILAIIAILPAAACVAPAGSPFPVSRLSYGVPFPPTATYHIADSVEVSVTTPVGDAEITTGSLLSMNMLFASDPGGIGVMGTVSAFEAYMTNTATGPRYANTGDVAGILTMVVDRLGGVQVASVPELRVAAEELSPFPAVAYELFPRFPNRGVGPGGTWVDTLTWSILGGVTESRTTAISTYTVIGDTLVSGRTLLKIAVARDVRVEEVDEQGDTSTTQEMSGTTTGFVLWDADRRLSAYVQLNRELQGTNQVPGAGSIGIRFRGPLRIWLEY